MEFFNNPVETLHATSLQDYWTYRKSLPIHLHLSTHPLPLPPLGNRHLRGILIETAWRAILKDPALARYYEKLCVHTGAKRAIVAVARKLIGRIRAAFCKGELYQIDYGAPLNEVDNPPATIASA